MFLRSMALFIPCTVVFFNVMEWIVPIITVFHHSNCERSGLSSASDELTKKIISCASDVNILPALNAADFFDMQALI